jgi:hypothetical protein
MLDEIGLFDERFFLYYEETDFCLRAHQHGLDTFYLPKSRVEHVGAASTGWKDFGKPRTPHWFTGRRYYWLKHGGRAVLWLANALFIAGVLIGRSKAKLLGRTYHQPPRLLRDFARHSLTFTPIGVKVGPS